MVVMGKEIWAQWRHFAVSHRPLVIGGTCGVSIANFWLLRIYQSPRSLNLASRLNTHLTTDHAYSSAGRGLRQRSRRNSIRVDGHPRSGGRWLRVSPEIVLWRRKMSLRASDAWESRYGYGMRLHLGCETWSDNSTAGRNIRHRCRRRARTCYSRNTDHSPDPSCPFRPLFGRLYRRHAHSHKQRAHIR
jgi:hypothetical protein